MENRTDANRTRHVRRSRLLLVATTLFGILYTWFVISSLIPSSKGSWVSPTVPFDPFDREQAFVKALFLLFVVGYVAAWKSELVAAVVFLLWYAAMFALSVTVFAAIHPGNSADGLVMGFPVLILGVLFFGHWFRQARARRAPAA